MRPLTSLRIAGKRHAVMWDVKPASENEYGEYCPVTLQIRVCSGLAPDEERETLLHEVLHAVAAQTDTDMPEAKHGRFSVGLFEALKNNPKLVSYLFEDGEDGTIVD
jgi:hypothetical protein